MILNKQRSSSGRIAWCVVFEDGCNEEIAWLHLAAEDPTIRRGWQRFINNQPIKWKWQP